MSFGFEKGKVYNRQRDIHGKFKGQERSGIITPKDFPVVFIITGEAGKQHGYNDRQRDDGVFEYFGEGQSGHMTLNGGNRAIADHSINGESLLLFKMVKGGLEFIDEMVCESYDWKPAAGNDGAERQAIVFELRPLEAVKEAIEGQSTIEPGVGLEALRKRASASASATKKKTSVGERTVYERSMDVRNFVLLRANGNCEGCEKEAPFTRKDGTPYLEPHHIRRVSDGGPDHPAHVIALCPNCHREVHSGINGKSYNDALRAKMPVVHPWKD